jgi:hypothetical protein
MTVDSAYLLYLLNQPPVVATLSLNSLLSLFVVDKRSMAKRYEIARSSSEPPLMLIFPEGSWESLPFEIRLLCPWHESEFRDGGRLTARQRSEIAARGYSIENAVDTAKTTTAPSPRINDMRRRA